MEIFTIFFYYTICGCVAFLSYIVEHSYQHKQEITARFLIFLILLIPAALRYGIGTDYFSYESIYNHPNIEKIEIGFYWICYLLQQLDLNSQWLFVVIAILTYLPICFGLPKKGFYYSMFFFSLLFYLSTWSLIRQGLAVCWIWYASTVLLENRKIRFIFIILAASTIHLSACLMLPFYFIRNRFNHPYFIILVLAIGVFAVEVLNLIDIIFASELFLDSEYGNYAFSSYNRDTEIGSGLGVLVRLLIPIITLVYYIRGRLDRKFGYIAYASIAYIIAMLLAIKIHIFNRLVDLFSFAPIISIGIIAAYAKHRYKKIILAILVMLNIALFYRTIVSNPSQKSGGLGIYPYESIL